MCCLPTSQIGLNSGSSSFVLSIVLAASFSFDLLFGMISPGLETLTPEVPSEHLLSLILMLLFHFYALLLCFYSDLSLLTSLTFPSLSLC